MTLLVDGDAGEMAFGEAFTAGVDAKVTGTEPIKVAPAAAEPDVALGILVNGGKRLFVIFPDFDEL